MHIFPWMPSNIDAHCHLSSPRLRGEIENIFSRAQNNNIRNFLLAGIGPEDWQEQKKFCSQYANKERAIYPCFGLHPYWVAERTKDECERAMKLLEQELSISLALGETGLDFRTEILAKGNGGREQQREFFLRQLELAQQEQKVPVLHLVRCHEEAVQILRPLAPHLRPPLLHAFNAGPELAKHFLDLGCVLSIGGPLLRQNNQALRDAVKMTPLNQLLVESDSPDQPPPQLKGQNNEPWTIMLVAERIAELKELPVDEVLIAMQKNFLRLFAKELEQP